MRRALAEAAALTQHEREAANLYVLWGKRAQAIVAERGSSLVVEVSTMLEGEGTVYWRHGRECVPFEFSDRRTGDPVIGQRDMRPPRVGTAMFRSRETAAGRGGIEVVIGHDGNGYWTLDPRIACYLLLLPTSVTASVIEFAVVESDATACQRYLPLVRQWFRSADACRAGVR